MATENERKRGLDRTLEEYFCILLNRCIKNKTEVDLDVMKIIVQVLKDELVPSAKLRAVLSQSPEPEASDDPELPAGEEPFESPFVDTPPSVSDDGSTSPRSGEAIAV